MLIIWCDLRNGGTLQDGDVTEINGGVISPLGILLSHVNEDWTVRIRKES